MRGYLQRLVEPRAATREAPPVRAATRSLSPIAEQDPRGQVAAFVDPFEAPTGIAGPEPSAPAAAPVERAQSRPALAPAPALRNPAPAPKPMPAPVVQRFLATPAAPAMTPAPAMPAPALPIPAAPQAIADVANRPQTAPAPQSPAAPFTAPLPLPANPVPIETRASDSPAMRTPPLQPSPRMPSDALAPVHSLPAPSNVERGSALPLPRADDTPPLPAPDRPSLPARDVEMAPPLPHPKIETLDVTHGEAPRVPQVSTREIIVRERVVAPQEQPKPPSQPVPRGPRTAEEASVIGPLGRSRHTRSLLDLALR